MGERMVGVTHVPKYCFRMFMTDMGIDGCGEVTRAFRRQICYISMLEREA